MSQYIHSNICNFVQLLHLFSLALWSTETQKVTKAVQTDVCQIVILHLSIIWQFLKKMHNQRWEEATSHTFSWMKNPKDVLTLLAKWSGKVLPVDLCTDHAHYVKNHRSTVLGRTKNMAVQGGTVSHYYILVIRKFIDFISLFRHSVWFSFSLKQFPSAEFGICNI